MGRRAPTLDLLLPVKDFTLLYVECEPGLGRNNTRYADRGSKRLSDSYLSYRDWVWLAWTKAGRPMFKHGEVGIEIIAFWKKVHKMEDGLQTPFADVDAIDKGTLDALHLSEQCVCDCLDDDMRVNPLIVRKAVDKENPHVEIVIWRV